MKHARQDYNDRVQDSAGLIPDNEPVFLLRAQDNTSLACLLHWLELNRDGDAEATRLVTAHAGLFRQWGQDNKTKAPDTPAGLDPVEANPGHTIDDGRVTVHIAGVWEFGGEGGPRLIKPASKVREAWEVFRQVDDAQLPAGGGWEPMAAYCWNGGEAYDYAHEDIVVWKRFVVGIEESKDKAPDAPVELDPESDAATSKRKRAGRMCGCELRDRQWNPNTGKCEFCGGLASGGK